MCCRHQMWRRLVSGANGICTSTRQALRRTASIRLQKVILSHGVFFYQARKQTQSALQRHSISVRVRAVDAITDTNTGCRTETVRAFQERALFPALRKPNSVRKSKHEHTSREVPGLSSVATRDDQRDVICLGGPAVFLYICLNSGQKSIYR
jgi:hypothetical protein